MLAVSLTFIINGQRCHFAKSPILLSLIAAIYLLYYAAPPLLQSAMVLRGVQLNDDIQHSAQLVALVGWLALASGYLLATRSGRRLELPTTNLAASPIRAAICLLIVGVIASALLKFGLTHSAFLQPMSILSNFGQIGAGALLALALRHQLSFASQFAVKWMVVPLFLISQIPSGLVSTLIYPAVHFLIIFWRIRRKLPLLALLGLVAVAAALRPVMTEYRQLTWYAGEYSEATRLEKGALLLDLFAERLTTSGSDYQYEATEVAASRTNQLAVLAWVVWLTPDLIPYWEGGTYGYLFSTLIPRAVWPEKPEKSLGQDFGHKYDLLDLHDTSTSINFPQLAEAYANFGSLGVIVVSLIIGLTYRLVENLSQKHASAFDPITLSVGAYLISTLINIESDAGLVFGGLLQTTILLTLFNWIAGFVLTGNRGFGALDKSKR